MLLAAAFIFAFVASSDDPCSCLPKDIKPTEVVSVQTIESSPGRVKVKKTTVRDRLRELGARCVKGRLRDASGKEIYFYRMVGCWGNPPDDYQEILDLQNRELTRLKKLYLVIEMTCNPTGQTISAASTKPILSEHALSYRDCGRLARRGSVTLTTFRYSARTDASRLLAPAALAAGETPALPVRSSH